MEYYIEPNNNPAYPRYLIVNDQFQYWNGSNWVSRDKGLLYADTDIAVGDMQRLRQKDFGIKPNMKFTIPFVVEVSSKDNINMEEIRDWLKKALGFYIDINTFGNGPKESLVVPHLELQNMSPTNV